MSYTLNDTMAAAPVYTVSTSNPYSQTGGTIITSNVNWANLSSITSNDLAGHSLEVKGNANFDGELTIKGKKLSEVLDNIESRLAILHPNKELEEKWENLRGLREAYVELEREIIEKEAMWKILKK